MKRLYCFPLLAGVVLLAANVGGQDAPPSSKAAQLRGDVFETTVRYVEQFYPLWFTYYQTLFAKPNRLVGPDKISPIYHYVVAINDDTLYVSCFLDLSREPVILTIPDSSPDLSYSVLMLDPYGIKFFNPSSHRPRPGRLRCTAAASTEHFLPRLPRSSCLSTTWRCFFRIDKFTNGVDVTSKADNFRRALAYEPLYAYEGRTCPPDTPPGGVAEIVPEATFAFPFKTTADTLIAKDPIFFLRMLQIAVLSQDSNDVAGGSGTIG